VDGLQCPSNHSLYLDVQQMTGVQDGYTYMCSDDVKDSEYFALFTVVWDCVKTGRRRGRFLVSLKLVDGRISPRKLGKISAIRGVATVELSETLQGTVWEGVFL